MNTTIPTTLSKQVHAAAQAVRDLYGRPVRSQRLAALEANVSRAIAHAPEGNLVARVYICSFHRAVWVHLVSGGKLAVLCDKHGIHYRNGIATGMVRLATSAWRKTDAGVAPVPFGWSPYPPIQIGSTDGLYPYWREVGGSVVHAA